MARLRHVRLHRDRDRPQAAPTSPTCIAAAALLLVYGPARRRWCCSLLGPFVAFFGTGYFSGFGAVTAEIYPTSIRATAQGLTYNIGRIASAAAPFAVGTLAADARLRHRALDLLGRVPARGRLLDLDSRDAGKPAGLSRAPAVLSRVSSEFRGRSQMTLMLKTCRIGLAATLFALVTTLAPVAHAAAADLAGLWKGTMETQIGPAETTITIEPGAALAGKVQVMNYEGRIEKGSVDGEK